IKSLMPVYIELQLFVILAALPLTPNRKVDRRALPALEQTLSELVTSYVAPRNAVEELVAGIWVEVLGLSRVGIHDNFFELGGHSLLATQVISRAREAFKVEVPLRRLFEAPTVSGLALCIEMAIKEGAGLQAPPLCAIPRGGELALSFTQPRLWFLDQLEPGSPFYNIPAAVRLRGALDSAALAASITAVGRRHEALRTRFASADGRPVQIVEQELTLNMQVIDLSHLPEAEREVETRRRASEEAQRPFDLARGPLLRASLIKLQETEHVLLVTMHHIVSDGWSIGILMQEVAALYHSFTHGDPSC